jgi:hypothetical protein
MSDPEDFDALLAASSLGSEQSRAIREQAPAAAREHARRILNGEDAGGLQRIRPDLITGRTYLERGHPVQVLIRWGPGGGPRNVLIERADGSRVVRPFRGLRRPR